MDIFMLSTGGSLWKLPLNLTIKTAVESMESGLIPQVVLKLCNIDLCDIYSNIICVKCPEFSLLFGTICGMKVITHDYKVS